MGKKAKPRLGRSPLPPKTGGPHKSAKDYDRKKWKKSADEDPSH